MQSPRVAVVDVGHGACAVVTADNRAVVIDAGPKNGLLQFLEREGIRKIDRLLISHADEDHISGVIGLLSSKTVSIGSVHVNSDAMKSSKTWDSLLYELSQRDEQSEIDFQTSLARTRSDALDLPGVRIEIISPSKHLAGKGPGARHNGRRVSSNSASAVIRVSTATFEGILFAGDLDDVGLDDALAAVSGLNSKILVFPHHGGRPGGETPAAFAERLCKAVRPSVVVFSIGRNRYDNPLPEIVEAVREAAPNVRILCTQLSKHCAQEAPATDTQHLSNAFSVGRETGVACAGTVVIDLGSGVIVPNASAHATFIGSSVQMPMCREHRLTSTL